MMCEKILKLMCIRKNVKKVGLPTLCGPKNWQMFALCYVFLIQIIDGKCIFSSLLADVPPGSRLANVPPPSNLGGYILKINEYIYIYMIYL